MIDELRALLEKTLQFYPEDMRERLLMDRRRPRLRQARQLGRLDLRTVAAGGNHGDVRVGHGAQHPLGAAGEDQPTPNRTTVARAAGSRDPCAYGDHAGNGGNGKR